MRTGNAPTASEPASTSSAAAAATDYWARSISAFIDEGVGNLQRAARLPGLYRKAQAVRQGVTPSEVVYEEDRVKLLHYTGGGPPRYKTPLLFVFALVNRPYILDLKPGKSVVEHFVRAGFDTYLVDWGVPSEADRHLTLDHHVNGYLLNVVDHLAERTGCAKASILGYCMGGTMSAMFTALHPEKVKNLMLLAAGIDFNVPDGLLNLWTRPDIFDVDRFVAAHGNAPAAWLQNSFLMLKPIGNFVEKPINFWERLDDDAFIEDFFFMEGWLNDNIPVPGEVFREFVRYLYQQNRLVHNTMPVGKHVINLKNITCPVLNIMATKDDLVPCASSLPFNDLVGSTDRKTLQLKAGHIGLAVGSKAQSELWPSAVQWLAERS